MTSLNNTYIEYNSVSSVVQPTTFSFGNVVINMTTGEVTGLSDDISEDAKTFWGCVRKFI